MPYCKLPADHEGSHEGSAEDGWQNIRWSGPDLIDYRLRREDSQRLTLEEQLNSLCLLAQQRGYAEAAEMIRLFLNRTNLNSGYRSPTRG